MNGTFFLSLPPWALGGTKRSNIIKFQLQSQFQIFLYQNLCLLTNERYKTYQTVFSFCYLGQAPGVVLGGYRGMGVKTNFSP